MKKWIAKAVKWIWGIVAEEIKEPFKSLEKKIDAQGEEIAELKRHMTEAHKYDKEARECDLASLDDQICQQIEKCRLKGCTTAEERRRVGRMPVSAPHGGCMPVIFFSSS